MFALLHLLFAAIFDRFKSRQRLEIENLYLRHQLNIAMRVPPRRLRLRGADRAFIAWIIRRWPHLLSLSHVVRPDTILRWHRAGFRAYWRWKSRGRPGRPRISSELQELIRRMSRENRLWGAPRIHGGMLKLGFDVAESTVSKYMIRHRGPPSQTWRTFLRNHADAIAAIDLCAVHTATFECLFALIVISHERRQLLWFDVTRHPPAEWLAQQIVEAFPWDTAPAYLVRDNDHSYGQVFLNRLRSMGIRDRPTAPRLPWQNPYA
ncbi:MAG: helix-turn-helix domain-containing protein [Hyphomicrobiales bacterium]|nr:helix-turn-helix domain-containing protein [Hyphomicrobiales bacterium]